MPIEGKLLDILCCPVSKSPLRMLGQEKLDLLNTAISNGEALYVNGSQVETPLAEALITQDNKVVYAVESNIPVLLEEKGIGTTQFEAW